MMPGVTLAAVVAGVDAVDAAAPATAPASADASAFASAFDALFAGATGSGAAAMPPGSPQDPGESAPVAEVAPTSDLQTPVADPFALLGIPLASQPPDVMPPAESVPWRRPTLDRVAVAASLTTGALLENAAASPAAIDAAGSGDSAALQGHPLALAATATGPDALTAVVAAGNQIAAEPRAAELASVDSMPVDGSQLALAGDPAPVQRHAPEPAPRALPPPVTVPMQSPEWNREFASRVNWMVERGEQFASIRLTPEQLGPVEVRLAIREGEASIWFGAAQADTRAAIEQALPRLREMLAASGLALADSGVFQGSPRDPRHGLVRADARRAAGESVEPIAELRTHNRRAGLIDDYA